MPETDAGLESLLAGAIEFEKKYDWSKAAETYAKAREAVPAKDPLRLGNVLESRAHALYKHAFQAGTKEEFSERLAAATSSYSEAEEAYRDCDADKGAPWSRRCDAMIAYLEGWSSTQPHERIALFGKSWALAKESMDGYETIGNGCEFAKCLTEFSFAAIQVYLTANDFKERERTVREALAYSKKAATLMEGSPNKELAARVYFNVSQYAKTICHVFSDISKREAHLREFGEWFKKAFEASREATIIEFTVGIVALPAHISEEELEKILGEASRMAGDMRDRLVNGRLFDYLEFHCSILAHAAENEDERNLLFEKARELTHMAKDEFTVISHISPDFGPMWPGAPECGYNLWKAMFESDLTKKREYAQKSMDAWKDELEAAVRTGWLQIAYGAYWDGTRLLTELAKTEKDDSVRRRTLEESMNYIEKYMEVCSRLYPYSLFNDSIKTTLADTEYQLSELATSKDEKVKRIRDAVKHKKENIEAFKAEAAFMPALQPLADSYFGMDLSLCGKWSLTLYGLTSDRDDLSAAIDALQESSSSFQKAGWPSRCAESRWQTAQAYCSMGDHSRASKEFIRASSCYQEAAENMPKAKDLFLDYAHYMKAWSAVEDARHHHLRQERTTSRECFEKASELFGQTGRWAYLASDYTAWAKLENAEDLSRNNSCREAAIEFAEAARLFNESSVIMKAALPGVDEPDERKMVLDLVKAAMTGEAYCRARILLEEAKALDEDGEEAASSDRYGLAVTTLEDIMEELDDEHDRKETRLIVYLAKAWQAMTKAEAEASSALYGEAAKLFDEAKLLTHGQREKLMTSGHSRFCKALEVGMQFADTGQAELHNAAVQHLEGASKFYLKAGDKQASEYANASKLLLDAYLYMDKASKEEDPEKRAKLYTICEKVLEASAASFEEARYQGRKAEVERLLEKARRDKELAVSLNNTLRAPEFASATTLFAVPTPTRERAAGLEKFDHADVQANLIARPTDLHVGQSLNIVIELVNAGRGTAQLTKVEEVIPRGFDIVSEPEKYRVEDSYLNMKGRRLDALKTEDVKLALKPTVRGEFTLRPRIMYLDEAGKYKSCEPDSVTIIVKELGITGWLKGPERKGG